MDNDGTICHIDDGKGVGFLTRINSRWHKINMKKMPVDPLNFDLLFRLAT